MSGSPVTVVSLISATNQHEAAARIQVRVGTGLPLHIHGIAVGAQATEGETVQELEQRVRNQLADKVAHAIRTDDWSGL